MREFACEHSLCGGSRHLCHRVVLGSAWASAVVLFANVVDILSLHISCHGRGHPGRSVSQDARDGLTTCSHQPARLGDGCGCLSERAFGGSWGPEGGQSATPLCVGHGQLWVTAEWQLAPVTFPHTHAPEGKPRPLAHYYLRVPKLHR